jgi:hypothetical protein
MYCVAKINGPAIGKVKNNGGLRCLQIVDCKVSAIANDNGIACMCLEIANIGPRR